MELEWVLYLSTLVSIMIMKYSKNGIVDILWEAF